jgi:hypothetical protein
MNPPPTTGRVDVFAGNPPARLCVLSGNPGGGKKIYI